MDVVGLLDRRERRVEGEVGAEPVGIAVTDNPHPPGRAARKLAAGATSLPATGPMPRAGRAGTPPNHHKPAPSSAYVISAIARCPRWPCRVVAARAARAARAATGAPARPTVRTTRSPLSAGAALLLTIGSGGAGSVEESGAAGSGSA